MRPWLSIGLMACVVAAWHAAAGQSAYVGFAYPAGGQVGAVVRVTAAGQRLRGVSAAYVSGTGVRVAVTGYVGAGGPLNQVQQDELRRRIRAIADARTAARTGRPAPVTPAPATPVALPDLPDLRNLETKTPAELKRIGEKLLNPQNRPKPPLAEIVSLDVTIDADAVPGDRELRLRTPTGLSNPLLFQVGALRETRERDEDELAAGVPPPSAAQLPVVLNGQILPGEVDRIPVQLKRDQQVVIAVQARNLIPYLADAVPGWFQAVVAVHDVAGKELAYADDNGFDPDPVLRFRAPADGDYTVAIRDAIYRGRQDFVYRVIVGEDAAVQPLLPLPTRWAVPVALFDPAGAPNPLLAYLQVAGAAPQREEVEPNNTAWDAPRVALPQVVLGAVAQGGDTDQYRFDGRAGDEIVAEVYARRLGSPLDALLRVTDAAGRVLAWNDDYEDKGSGLLTHHADACVTAKLPADGAYAVQVSDAQGHGGEAYRYYLRIGPRQPDFALRMTPSSLGVPAGGLTLLTVYALRKDGWNGEIVVTLKDPPAGFALSGARIPAGRDSVRMTLTGPRRPSDAPVALRFEGRAQIDGKTVVRPMIPADDLMQAFAYHHLVPARELTTVVTRGGRNAPVLELVGEWLRIPAGGEAHVSYAVQIQPNTAVRLTLSDPPTGITLKTVVVTPGRVTLTLQADAKQVGYADNLIVQAATEAEVKGAAGAPPRKQRIDLGVLPAIPFEVVRP